MANEKRLIVAHDLWSDIMMLPHNGDMISSEEVEQAIMDATTVDAVVLPCKIGDKVYRINMGNYHSNWKPFVEELTVTEISWKKEKYGGKDLGFAIIANGIRYKFTSIGKSVFLTQEAARAKMDGDGNA